MSDTDSDDDIVLFWWYLNKKRKKRRPWIHPALLELRCHSAIVWIEELKQHSVKFKNCYRMNPDSFKCLLNIVGPHITKCDTNCRVAIEPAEKLLITLRYLSTGCSFKALSHIYMRGDTTIGLIVRETTRAIWQYLQPLYMPVPKEADWRKKSERFYELWDLPNCLGSIDGKHFRIKKIYKTGSCYYNYKGYFSIVLMACADADGIFTTIDVGAAGRNSDGAVFRASAIKKLLEKEKLNIPSPQPMFNDNKNFPFYFVGDEAFPLKINLMRPYPQRNLDNDKRQFNYRLSRARKSVECGFGMLVAKFEIFQKPMCCGKDTATSVIKAACILHNFIKYKEGKFSLPQVKKNMTNQIINTHISSNNINKSAYELRNQLKDYLVNEENALPWQKNYIVH